MFKLCLVRPTSQYFLSLDQQKHQFICIRLYSLHEKLSFLIEDCINTSWFHINCVQIYDILWNAAAGIHFAPGEIVEIAMTFLFGVSHFNYNQTLSELSTSPLCWRRVKKTKKKKVCVWNEWSQQCVKKRIQLLWTVVKLRTQWDFMDNNAAGVLVFGLTHRPYTRAAQWVDQSNSSSSSNKGVLLDRELLK